MIKGDIVFTKAVEHRELLEMREQADGRERPRVNHFGYRFQPKLDLMSHVGVFLFLGTMPERWQLEDDGELVKQVLDKRMGELGWVRKA